MVPNCSPHESIQPDLPEPCGLLNHWNFDDLKLFIKGVFLEKFNGLVNISLVPLLEGDNGDEVLRGEIIRNGLRDFVEIFTLN